MQKTKNPLNQHLKGQPAIHLALYPIIVFIVGNLMFDEIGNLFAVHGLQQTESILPSANHHEVIAGGHTWAASANAYLLIMLFTMTILCQWIWTKARGRLAAFYLFISGTLISLGLTYLVHIDTNNRPIKAIFLVTFRSLRLNEYLQKNLAINTVSNTLATINILSIIVTAMLCAFAPLLARKPINGWTEKELFNRVKDLRLITVVASAFLIAGTLHMHAWMAWSTEILNTESLEAVINSVTFYWGSVFTIMLAAFYVPISLVLQNRAEAVMEDQHVEMTKRNEWLSSRGLSLQISNQLPQVAGILGPLATTPIGNILSNLNSLPPGQ